MISVSLPENYYVYLLLLKNYVKCVYLQYHNVPYKAPLTYMSYKHILHAQKQKNGSYYKQK